MSKTGLYFLGQKIFLRIIFGDYIDDRVDGVKEYCSSYPATLLDDTRMATLTSRKATLELTPFPPPNDTSLAPKSRVGESTI